MRRGTSTFSHAVLTSLRVGGTISGRSLVARPHYVCLATRPSTRHENRHTHGDDSARSKDDALSPSGTFANRSHHHLARQRHFARPICLRATVINNPPYKPEMPPFGVPIFLATAGGTLWGAFTALDAGINLLFVAGCTGTGGIGGLCGSMSAVSLYKGKVSLSFWSAAMSAACFGAVSLFCSVYGY
ncbi:hypothetical protein pmac_cds_60 [Pandoravirus macleodensis]|uniref:Uncharacterized protein n=1 Tax=Pandoravirus macleodensis TaxID=2107707 RepID=A0A2U7UE56_9VIRU|nr:hypothetical protein pmac_cds_60 [Pandoravirus macleodensis]AVK76748.1 hypothetical protein pmac_cds_60 [Pandoravirus macleodensis]